MPNATDTTGSRCADDPGSLAELYRTMRRIRRFEETVVELVNRDEIPGTTHEYIGQEAVAAGICAALRPSDVLTSTHRGHGHLIAKGASIPHMMAELMARETGTNRARGGSMHVADMRIGVLGANGIVAGGVPFALGAAWANHQRSLDNVAVAFFGDGAMSQGLLYESLNLASLWQLPVIFVCENNGYAVSLSVNDGLAGAVVDLPGACHVPAETVDGMDVRAVFDAAERAVGEVRTGNGPAFLECVTYRYAGHHTAEASLKMTYRSDAEIDRWRERDPLLSATAALGQSRTAEIDDAVERELGDAIEFARTSTIPDQVTATNYAYADGDPVRGVEG